MMRLRLTQCINPPLKMEVLSSHSLLENLVGGSTPPPPRMGGTHYAMGLALKEFAWARDCLALALLIVNTGIHEIFY